jgi:hypothetical protein
LEGTLAHLHHTMQEITWECTQGGVTFGNVVTSCGWWFKVFDS